MLEQPGRGTLVITSPRTEDIGKIFRRVKKIVCPVTERKSIRLVFICCDIPDSDSDQQSKLTFQSRRFHQNKS